MKQVEQKYYCAFDICARRLHDFGFICKENGSLYCDEICMERDLEQCAPKEVVTWQ